jgi:hypothetical protein
MKTLWRKEMPEIIEECNMFGCDHQTNIICSECNRHYCDECFDEHYLGAHA